MKFNKLLIKLIASFLSLSIIICCLSPITANAQEIEYLKVQKKIQEQYQEGILPEDILEALSDKEIETLVNSYAQQGTVSSMSSILNLDNDPEVLFVDSLALYYYNYYQDHGIFPDENDMPKATRSDLVLNEYSKVIKLLGYNYTNSQIAQQLVNLGIMIGLNAPMLMLHLIAILAGMIILAVTVAILYCSVAIGVNNWLEALYLNSRKNMDLSRSYSAAVAVQSQNGEVFWKAYLVDYAGLGGIWVDDPISMEIAKAIVRNNLPNINVFTIQHGQAQHLAIWTYDGLGRYTSPEAHRTDADGNYKPLNHQHIHTINTNNIRGKTHIYFALPYLQ